MNHGPVCSCFDCPPGAGKASGAPAPREDDALPQVSAMENLKVEINNLIWVNAPGNLTLERAEEIACQILELILNPTRE